MTFSLTSCCLQPTVPQLRAECERIGLDSRGRKPELEARLEEYAADASVHTAATEKDALNTATAAEQVMEPREREQPPSKRRKADDAEVVFHWPLIGLSLYICVVHCIYVSFRGTQSRG